MAKLERNVCMTYVMPSEPRKPKEGKTPTLFQQYELFVPLDNPRLSRLRHFYGDFGAFSRRFVLDFACLLTDFRHTKKLQGITLFCQKSAIFSRSTECNR